ncbi:acyltransferase family protein [Arthrobacter agilis]|uniref:acyltransferase family protein n=1 Tax=Arthrobacter agilis TaxID=37921 RepID=UPI0027D82EB8|nr:acyltransferase [Arthrobacter agilis]
MSTSSKPRESWIDCLRGLAILLVIADHSAIATAQRLGSAPHIVEALNDAANPFRMATLMFLSGMLLPQSLRKTRRQYFCGKFSHIAWPYLLWSCIILGVYSLGYWIQGTQPLGLGMFLRIIYSPPTLLWYLAYLLVFYLIAAWLSCRLKVLLIPLTMIASGLVGGDASWQSMLYLFGFFLAGDMAARTRAKWEAFMTNPAALAAGALLAVLAAAVSAAGGEVRYQAIWAVPVAGGIFVAIPIAKALATTRVGQLVAGEGRDSIVYYVTHAVVVLILAESLAAIGVSSTWAIYLVCFISALAVGWIALRCARRSAAVEWAFRLPLVRVRV